MGAEGERDSILAPGQRLDRYELLTPIASGGMATVWLARLLGKRGFERLVAIKTIRTEFSDDPAFEEMFLDEARIASGIQHPNVAQITDLGEERSVLYIVMEYVDGESLAKLRKAAIKRGLPIPWGVALRVLADACAGLQAAHELKDKTGEPLGIVHRDISPHNILVSRDGVVKVIDFGIAKAKNRMAKETGTGVIKGKVAYMAREQAMGTDVDRRADVYAIGVCLYELIAGELPFDGDNQLEVFQNVISLQPRPYMEGATPALIDDILDKALARIPEERYQTAASLERALEGAIQALGVDGSTEAVAAFVQDNLKERFQRRQELVDKALESAARRISLFPPTSMGTPSNDVVTVAKYGRPPSLEEAETVVAPSSPDARESRAPITDVPVVEKTSAAPAPSKIVALAHEEPEKRSNIGLWMLAAAAVGVALLVWRTSIGPPPMPPAPAAPVTPSASIAPALSVSASIAPSVSTSASASAPASASASASNTPPLKIPWPAKTTTPPTAPTTTQLKPLPSVSEAPTASAPPVESATPPDPESPYNE